MSASNRVNQLLDKEHDKTVGDSKDEVRRSLLQQLQSIMYIGLRWKAAKMHKEMMNEDTTAFWRIRSPTLEQAFADLFGLEGKDRKAMSGRGGYIKCKSQIKACGGKALEETCASVSLHVLAEQYGVQSRQLGHTIDLLAGIASRKTVPVKRDILFEQNPMTLIAIFAKSIKVDNINEFGFTDMIRDAPPHDAALRATYERARTC